MKGVKAVAIEAGALVYDPRMPEGERAGRVVAVRVNPACLMRTLVVRWLDSPGEELEELDEVEFGPMDD